MTAQTRRQGTAQGSSMPPQTCLCCSRPARIRGLCTADYQAARAIVLDGKMSWDDLIDAGMALPSHTGNGREPNAFRAKLAAFKASQNKTSASQLDLKKLLDR